jgi:hypothetical protein
MNNLTRGTSSTIEGWRRDMLVKIGISDRDYSDRDEMIWNSQLLSQKIWTESASKICGQSFVNRGKQQEERGASRVEIPEGDRPVNLRPIRPNLVRLMISVMVKLLAHAGNNEYWCVSPETVHFLESVYYIRLRDEDEGYSLAETSARIVLSQFQYSTNLGFRDGNGFEGADHPPLPNHSGKFHALTGGRTFEKEYSRREWA